MSLENHLTHLKERHQKIEQNINAEYLRPAPDDMRIATLKKEKLQLKQQITEAEQALHPQLESA